MSPTWNSRTRLIVGILLGLTLIAAVLLIRSIWTNLIIAALMAIVAGPIIEFLHTRLRLRRGIATLFTYIGFLLTVILLPIIFLAFMASLVELSFNLAEVMVEARDIAIVLLERFRAIDIFGIQIDLSDLVDPTIAALESLSLRDLLPSADDIVAFVSSVVGTTAGLALKGLGLIISALIALFFTFSYAVYISSDGGSLVAGFRKLIPPAYQFEISTLARRIGEVWHSYIIGQLGVMVVLGLVTWFVAWLLGLPQPLALGVMAGVLEIIPTLGPILAAIPAIFIALFQGSSRFDIPNILFAIIVGIAYLMIQELEDLVLTPQIQGKAVELPPLIVIISVTVGFHSFGFLGAIITVPVVATAKEIFLYLHAKVLQQNPYPNENTRPVMLATLPQPDTLES